MPSKPIHFDGQDLRVVAPGDLDPAVLPSTVVQTGGTTPFTAPQGGVDPTTDTQLATAGWVKANSGAKTWIGAVKSLVAVLPGSPVAGDRHILTTTGTINEWSGTAWVATAAIAGMVAYVTTLDALVRFSATTSTWGDISDLIDHGALKNRLGAGNHHLDQTTHDALTGVGAARKVLATPAAGGVPSLRDLDAADIKTGTVAPARGGTGQDSSAASGYPLLTAGVWGFATTIPWGSIASKPTTFAPSTHATSHGSGGTDALALDASQITAGQLSTARGGTGANGSALAAKRFLASPVGATGPAAYRAFDVNDIPGATVAGQILQRNSTNTANEWAIINLLALGAAPSSREIVAGDYLGGGGTLAADVTLNWEGVDVSLGGTLVGRRPILNFIGATVTDDAANNRVDISISSSGGGSTGMPAIVAAIVFGG